MKKLSGYTIGWIEILISAVILTTGTVATYYSGIAGAKEYTDTRIGPIYRRMNENKKENAEKMEEIQEKIFAIDKRTAIIQTILEKHYGNQ